jgi:hypothetical protein
LRDAREQEFRRAFGFDRPDLHWEKPKLAGE